MDVKIKNFGLIPIKGVEERFSGVPYCEDHFEWYADTKGALLHSSDIHIGVLTAGHRAFDFEQVEYHDDIEIFCYESGSAIVLFCDIKDGKPDMQTVEIVRIQRGTQVVIQANKGHCVPIAEKAVPVRAIVISSKISSEHVRLKEIVHGIK